MNSTTKSHTYPTISYRSRYLRELIAKAKKGQRRYEHVEPDSELLKEYKQTNDENKRQEITEELIFRNLNLISAFISRLVPRDKNGDLPASTDDYVGQCIILTCKAIERYEESWCNKFSTYLGWFIRKAIVDENFARPLISVPRYEANKIYKKKSPLTPSETQSEILLKTPILELDASIDQDSDPSRNSATTYQEVISYPIEQDPFKETPEQGVHKEIAECMNSLLNSQERKTLISQFHLDDSEIYNPEALNCGVASRSRQVRKRIRDAISRIRNELNPVSSC